MRRLCFARVRLREQPQVCTATQPAGPDKIQRFLNLIGRCRNRRWRELRGRGIEQDKIKMIERLQRVEQRFERLVIALQLLKLHRQGVVEQSNNCFGRKCLRGTALESGNQRGRFKEARRFGWLAVCKNIEPVTA